MADEGQLLTPFVPKIAVIERNISLGREGIFCSELKAALCNNSRQNNIQGYLAGIGGTDVNPDMIKRVLFDALSRDEVSDAPVWITEEE